MIRTRFAPSPTGYLHIGGARTALFCWAYAKRHGGEFILRIEDTDVERHTEAAVEAIYDSMRWLGLDWDAKFDPPPRQMQRLPRYREVAEQLIAAGHAYRCYATREDLDAMREAQRARGEKPRYDGRWRPENAAGRTPPADVPPVVRFRTPSTGEVGWRDLVKGDIVFSNTELDDLVILRADGVPTYNFGVVVDDLDMGITHVIRGDDHVNNTPRQIHIFGALGAKLPEFAHVPMILGPDGQKLSKRHGAVSVMQYHDDGYLPEALLNALARLGWSHGDEELFSMEQFVQWFDLDHISGSPAQFDPEKLAWLNHEYIKRAEPGRLAAEVAPRLAAIGGVVDGGPPLGDVVLLLRDRARTLNELAEAAMLFYRPGAPDAAIAAAHVKPEIAPALVELHGALAALPAWTPADIGAATKGVLERHKLKMPQIAMPVRAAVFGQTQTPSLDHVLAIAGRERVLARLAAALG